MDRPTSESSKRKEPAQPRDGGADAAAAGETQPKQEEESGLAAGRRRFSRRLATFGLGEAQQPLLTDAVSSFDAEGNPR